MCKVADVCVGYTPASYEPITPYKFLTRTYIRNNARILYKFSPGDRVDDDIGRCILELTDDKHMLCKNGDEIVEGSVVECSYVGDRWVPLNVRKDKTEAALHYNKITANDYKVALNIWQSIQNPVTKDMISGLSVVPEWVPSMDQYYFRSSKRETFLSRNMMDFHNYVKRQIIVRPDYEGKSLVDLACGKAGDYNRWVEGKYKNIENPYDGACARTLQKPRDLKTAYVALDSSLPLTKEAMLMNQDTVCNVLWGNLKDDALDEYYEFAKPNTFDVVSCQFALHYFFENPQRLTTFLENVNLFLKPGGVFIGTCLDGALVKNALTSTAEGSWIEGKLKNKTIWRIRKLYKNDGPIKIGEAIEIYMESINVNQKEYLVDFDLLNEKLSAYDMKLILKDNFENYYKTYQGKPLTVDETEYSKLNVAFCYQKTKPKRIIKRVPK